MPKMNQGIPKKEKINKEVDEIAQKALDIHELKLGQYDYETNFEDQKTNIEYQANILGKKLTGDVKNGEFIGDDSMVTGAEIALDREYDKIDREIQKKTNMLSTATTPEEEKMLEEEIEELEEKIKPFDHRYIDPRDN